MKLKNRITYMVLGIFIFMIALWSIDIGVSGMVLEKDLGVEMGASNGWWVRSPAQQYHLGLYFAMAGTLTLCFAILRSCDDLGEKK